MNERARPYLLLGLIALAALASLWSIRKTLDAREVRLSRLATLRELEALATESAVRQSSRHDAAAAASGAAIDLAAGAATAIQGIMAQPAKTDRVAFVPGWALRVTQLVLDDAAFQDAGRLIEWAENQQPPWRLAACELTATAPGRGKAVLTFQALEREALPKP